MAVRKKKAPAPSLADQLNSVVTAGQEAWKALQKDESWEKWVTVGKAIDAGKRQTMLELRTNSPKGKVWSTVFGSWLAGTGFDKIDKSARSRLQNCIDQLPAVEKWRRTLTISERLQLNHPTTVLRKFLAATATPKKKDDQATDDKPKAKRATAVEVERLQRELSAAHAEIDRLQKEVAELERLRRPLLTPAEQEQIAADIETLRPYIEADAQEMAAAQAEQLAELQEPDANIVPPPTVAEMIDTAAEAAFDPDAPPEAAKEGLAAAMLADAMREANEARAAREAEINAMVDKAFDKPAPTDDPDLEQPQTPQKGKGRQLRRRPSQRAIKAAIAAQAPQKGSRRKSQ